MYSFTTTMPHLAIPAATTASIGCFEPQERTKKDRPSRRFPITVCTPASHSILARKFPRARKMCHTVLTSKRRLKWVQ